MVKVVITKKDICGISCISLTTVAIMMVVYAIKGIYPFGYNTISSYDMDELILPLFYHLWDWLHGESDAFFTWRIGGGEETLGDF